MTASEPQLASTPDQLCDDPLCALIRGHDGPHDPAFDLLTPQDARDSAARAAGLDPDAIRTAALARQQPLTPAPIPAFTTATQLTLTLPPKTCLTHDEGDRAEVLAAPGDDTAAPPAPGEGREGA